MIPPAGGFSHHLLVWQNACENWPASLSGGGLLFCAEHVEDDCKLRRAASSNNFDNPHGRLVAKQYDLGSCDDVASGENLNRFAGEFIQSQQCSRFEFVQLLSIELCLPQLHLDFDLTSGAGTRCQANILR